ncbi:Protein RTM1 [Diplodia seriata]|uniref:Protein RTM1 n=1 Tax=Diplodia seriata TaxID=420778 RepID=A0A1S8BGR3_9PEZI|nr:Protein RTM1 [Diplodia seriata]
MRHGHALYAYRPSKAGAVIFCILFIGATGIHMWKMVRRRSWFMTAFVIGGILEFIGYACRSASASQPFNDYTIFPYAIQNTYLLLAPTLFAASVYMTLGRVVLLTGGEGRSPVARARLTKAFVTGDVVCLLVQGGGGGMSTAAALSGMSGNPISSSNELLANAGKGLTIFGLVAQVVMFAGFVGVAGVFHARLNKWPTAGSVAPEGVARCWRRVMRALYLVSALVMVRNLVRVVEYCQGTGGYIMTHEAFIYVFDALPMLVSMVVLAVVYPGELTVLLKEENVGGGAYVSDELLSDRSTGSRKGGVHDVVQQA